MPVTRMLINYSPGEECRVAVVEDDRLEEYSAERQDAVSRVGNIYVGRVANVEPSIQAAFIDFGLEDHGFLHVTDLHPRYFPGEDEETTERVGKKTPRRERPPLQACLRRGQTIEVQVLKEGVGTKGPTLTTYLSIPGRFLVMMPHMDRVGVSRRVEDEEQRRDMRDILDQLDLPEGFGFILRTAGFERAKLELKRDLAYLLRLWKDMESRRERGSVPCLLYSESDLLVRALRDQLTPDIKEVIVDDPQALERASQFLKIVAPRSRPALYHYEGRMPLFHAYGIEEQIANIHASEVPLPSGGRLVIEETEALVAIDVNSGKSRQARDAETNAYRTDLEAVDEICRQIRLRDLGGLVINDLIDMRDPRHRRDVEARMRERLKRDRARTTIIPISSFGILEMTRQRMRGSHETVHYADCPTCRGRGVVQRPDSIAADALRSLAALLAHDRVSKAEMVVSPRVASELLSSRRLALGRLERRHAKHVNVRVSETVPVDRVTLFAYDAAGADIDVEKLPRPALPAGLTPWQGGPEDENWAVDVAAEASDLVAQELAAEAAAAPPPGPPPHPIEMSEGEPAEKRRRRRRRRGRGRAEGAARAADKPAAVSQPSEVLEPETAPGDEESGSVEAESAPDATLFEEPLAEPPAETPNGAVEPGAAGGRRRRRRRRRGRGGAPAGDRPSSGAPGAPAPEPAEPIAEEVPEADGAGGTSDEPGDGQRRRRRRRRRRGGGGRQPESPDAGAGHSESPPPAAPGARAPSRPAPPPPASAQPAPRRFLYATRRRLGPSERGHGKADE
jgi:ribonuclease E